MKKLFLTLFLLLLIAGLSAQNTKAFNQNASRSNHTRLAFSLSPVFSSPLGNSTKDTLLFRGTGAGLKMGLDYYAGKLGIGFSSGFISTKASESNVNRFVKQFSSAIGDFQATASPQQSFYFLLGPSVKLGQRVQFEASAKYGLFLNNSGAISIYQKNALQSSYRVEPSDKQAQSGLLTGLSIFYTTSSGSFSFGLTADYLHTKMQVHSYDQRREEPGPVTLSQPVNDALVGVTFKYNIKSQKGSHNGRPTGQRIKSPISDNSSSDSDGAKEENKAGEYCGATTHFITHPDGTTEEIYFTCPADALAYAKGLKAIRDEAANDNPQTRVQDHNSSRSNKSASIASPDGNNSVGNSGQTPVQDHNSSRSNKSASIALPQGENPDSSSGLTRVQDHNSSRSNKSASIASPDGNNSVGNSGQTPVQDHNSSRSNKSASIALPQGENPDGNSGQTPVQDHNSSRSNKSGFKSADNAESNNLDSSSGLTRVQDHNSSRSNKSASIAMPQGNNPDGNSNKTDAEDHNSSTSNKPAAAVTTSREKTSSLLNALISLEDILAADNNTSSGLLNNCINNLNAYRHSIMQIRKRLSADNGLQPAQGKLKKEVNEMNEQYNRLEQSIKQLGTGYTTISNVIKTKHETAKNSVGNIR